MSSWCMQVDDDHGQWPLATHASITSIAVSMIMKATQVHSSTGGVPSGCACLASAIPSYPLHIYTMHNVAGLIKNRSLESSELVLLLVHTAARSRSWCQAEGTCVVCWLHAKRLPRRCRLHALPPLHAD